MTTRVQMTTRARAAYEAARETDRRAAALLRRLSAEAADLVAARRADLLDRAAEDLETARDRAAEAAAETAATRSAYLAARSALLAADLLEYSAADPSALLDLATASTHRAIDRREAESAADGRALRARYAATRATAADLLEADAVQEAAADLLAAVVGDPDHPDRPAWIDGEPLEMTDRETGDPVLVERRDLPLAYVAARSAGRALDRVMYADGGRQVKMTAREARAAYREAAALAPLADRADLLAAEAAETGDPETAAAAREARAEYMTAARRFAASAVVVETRRTSDPIAPAPEAALIEAERVERVLAEVREPLRENAARLARAFFMGAETVREAAREAGMPEATARRAWSAVRAAALLILAEDGERRDFERAVADGERRREAMTRFRADRAEARSADALRAEVLDLDPAETVRDMWSAAVRAARPARLRETARFTPSDVRDLAALFYRTSAE